MGLFAVQRDKAISDVLVTEHTGERVDGGFVRYTDARLDLHNDRFECTMVAKRMFVC